MAELFAVVTMRWGVVIGVAPALQIRIIIHNGDADDTSPAWVAVLLIGPILRLAHGAVTEPARWSSRTRSPAPSFSLCTRRSTSPVEGSRAHLIGDTSEGGSDVRISNTA
jgi:hypothetical protein